MDRPLRHIEKGMAESNGKDVVWLSSIRGGLLEEKISEMMPERVTGAEERSGDNWDWWANKVPNMKS